MMKVAFISFLAIALFSTESLGKKTGGGGGGSSSSFSSSSSYSGGYRGSRGEDQCYFGEHLVDISSSCCTGWGRLNKRNSTLDQELQACETEVLDAMLADLTTYCDADAIECTIDYRDFGCDEAYIVACSEEGGAYVERDETSICTYNDGDVFTTHSLDRVMCVPSVCTADEIRKILDVPAVTSDGGTCEYEGFDNIRVNGINITAYRSSSSSDGNGDDGSIGAVIGVVAVIVVLCGCCCGLLHMCKRRQQQQEEAAAAKQAQITAAAVVQAVNASKTSPAQWPGQKAATQPVVPRAAEPDPTEFSSDSTEKTSATRAAAVDV